MGCCCSRWCKKKKEQQKTPTTAESRPYSGYSNTREGGGTYEKTVGSTDSNMSGGGDLPKTDSPPVFVGIYDYKPGNKASAEISVREGDRFRLIPNTDAEKDPDWLFVMRVKDSEDRRWNGYVPKAFVAPLGSLDSFPWYFGTLNGTQAETLLSPLPDSSFLVRKRVVMPDGTRSPAWSPASIKHSAKLSPGTRSDHVLCVKRNGKISHRPIYETEDDLVFILRGKAYQSIPLMIKEMCEDADTPQVNGIPGGRMVLKGWPKKKLPGGRVHLSLETQRSWREIPRSQIRLGSIKGGGHFGIVYEGAWTMQDGKSIPVAVKALKHGSMRAKQKFLHEAVTMKNLQHKHLVELYGIVSESEPFWIITEYVKDGSLRDYLLKRKSLQRLLPEKALIDICIQICDGMRYLEEKQVVHRDLAARNILVSEESVGIDPMLMIKIADFGLARLVEPWKLTDSDKKPTRADVPTKWAAPEVLQDDVYSSASDVWSFGVVVHEVFSHGQEPYGILLHPAVRQYVVKHRQILRQHPTVPNRVYEIMKKCFNYEPNQRPTFNQLYAFFSAYYRKPGETSMTDTE